MAPSLRSRGAWLGALLFPTTLLAVWSCNTEDISFDSSGVTVINEELGIRISDADEWGQSARYLRGGIIEMYDPSITVEVDGLGSHEMGIYSQYEDETRGGGAYTEVTDVATGESRYVYYMPQYSAVAIGDEDGGVMVMANPDGSYDVTTMQNFQPFGDEYDHAEDGLAALTLVEEYNDFSSLSDFMLITMYAQGQGAGPEFRNYNDVQTGVETARTPAVCTLFQEFCECTVCKVVGQTGGACTGCPDL